MTFHSLDSADGADWFLAATAGAAPGAFTREIAARVPGQVHLDLVAAGSIPDPYDGANETQLAWIGRTDWRYRTVFDWHDDGHTRHDLVALGLDTAATIRLNGQLVASTANQHRSYRFDVRDALVDGSNELVVEFRAPLDFADEQAKLLGARPHVNQHPFNAMRKMACDFGWDWGIDLSSSGIWKSIGIDSWSGVRIAGVRPLVEVSAPAGDRASGRLDARVSLEWADAASAVDTEITVQVAGTTVTALAPAGTTELGVVVDAGEIDLWWPRGYGAQPRYEVTVTAGDDRWSALVGFRSVQLDTTPDELGTRFTVIVNGREVNIRGANWIPDDTFVTRVGPERYLARVNDAVEANMNLLRVWGGGLYEHDDFYDICDELGMLVWQDFLFACAAYAEEEPLRGEVEAEAREQVARLSRHPSLVLWNGCNENIWGYLEWDWRRRLEGRTWGEGYYFDLLPSIVAELDPTRPYSPGSPFSFMRYAHPNDARHGTMHLWDVWNERDYTAYREHEPRFASEFGFQGPPAWTTLTGAVHDEPLDPYGEQMLVHQKADQGNIKLERGLGAHLPKWRNIDEWHFATQLNQARAIAFGIEHFRSLHPRNTGQIVWQLNDSWPVISWAAVDFSGIRKPAWHALRRVYGDRLLTVQPHDGGAVLVAHNDRDEGWRGEVEVTRMTLDGDRLATETHTLDLGARESARFPLGAELLATTDAAGEFVLARAGDDVADAPWYFSEDPKLRLRSPADALAATWTAGDDGTVRLSVTAASLVKDLVLQADRIAPGARVDSGLVTLAPGDSHTFLVTGTGGAELAGHDRFPTLCSVNDLIA
ncbi:glycoside hydrolase family 2 protein [Agromyces sp. ISL-38]|uniref:glycoside hydrolase family 2 protein n=1 Tax=Agromyces sp. ISL-38 TaxID=2819107 RepID=UPI001BE6892C|nr:glycoside hydrolase family 2 protein [Agromyces sp. ISL-38]MBT2499639.1 glycoside hydrolase family 2 protein [Agromyces sp. ISL-38]MBT2516214.1 glycoside hydrolase family 2 protein [Streptomyces sp. ISL-90]